MTPHEDYIFQPMMHSFLAPIRAATRFLRCSYAALDWTQDGAWTRVSKSDKRPAPLRLQVCHTPAVSLRPPWSVRRDARPRPCHRPSKRLRGPALDVELEPAGEVADRADGC